MSNGTGGSVIGADDPGKAEAPDRPVPATGGARPVRNDEAGREAKTMLLGQLVPCITHELNNQLSTILGMAQIIDVQCERNNVLKPSLDLLIRAAEASADLLRRLSSISNGNGHSSGPSNLSDRLMYLKPLLDRVVKGKAQVHLHLRPDLPVVLTDHRDVETILLAAALMVSRYGCIDGRLSIQAMKSTHGSGVESGPQAARVRVEWTVPLEHEADVLVCLDRALGAVHSSLPLVELPRNGQPLALEFRLEST
jgi:hypothetical protein